MQSPTLNWIVERYNEFKRRFGYYVTVTLENGVKVRLGHFKIKQKEMEELAEKLRTEKARVEKVELEEAEVKPPPPYTTDEMLADAARYLKMSSKKAMQIAQSLFEMGLITYHRTDSTRVSDVGLRVAREWITDNIGEEEYAPRRWGEGGAHECIRPTRPVDSKTLLKLVREGAYKLPQKLTRDHLALYDLVFRRFMASQMKPAKTLRQKAVVVVSDIKVELEGVVEVLKHGFSKVYPLRVQRVAKLEQGVYSIRDVEYYRASDVSLYNEGDVVELMRKREIGRPSTYATILATLLKRGYVRKNEKGQLIPTTLGFKVNWFLRKNYEPLVSEERTRYLEKLMREIEEGKSNYQEVLAELYREVTSLR